MTQKIIPPPYKHQLTALKKLDEGSPVNPAAFALLMEMGAGKSRPLLEDWWSKTQKNLVDDLLIVAPSGCYLNWATDTKNPAAEPGEIQKWLPSEDYEKCWVFPWVSGGGVKYQKSLTAFLHYTGPKRRVFLVNVEATSRVRLVRESIEKFLKSRRCVMAVDESTCIMHESSARTQFIQNMGKLALYRRILTGLVDPEDPMNVFSQYWFLDWRILGFRNFLSFRARYAIVKRVDFRPPEEKERGARKLKLVLKYHHQTEKAWLVSVPTDPEFTPVWIAKRYANRGDRKHDTNFEFWVSDWLAFERGLTNNEGDRSRGTNIIVGYQNLDELKAKIAASSYRVLKSEVLDLPPKIWLFRDVELSDEQARMYEEMKKHATTELEGRHATVEMKMHQVQKLHEIVCGHIKDEEGGIIDIPSKRIEALMDVLAEHSGKAVIWAPYPRALEKILDALKTAYGDKAAVGFWGATSKPDRADAKHRIQQDDNTRFIVANQSVGGEGNTWTAANLTVYFANSRKNKDRQQSEDRTHRPGQTQSCTYVDLRARRTVDERWVDAIRNKMDLAAALTGDAWRKWLV